ncbi:MAG: S41 family peptidase [Bacteroidetes bacterium]|nr:S41 family peptidase [Bacteroidota bacterium]HET6242959.1 S41 family peptidase [Bacteroidia bacterium]
MEKRGLPAFLPLIFALLVILGIWIGLKLDYVTEGRQLFAMPSKNFNKLNELINFIEQEYVDEVSKEELVEKAINSLLEGLDPHSNYISPKELAAHNDPLEGNFEGIGIEFSVQKDTVTVITPIAGGPSEAAGIIAGDRFIKVDGVTIAGINIANEDIVSKLKGRKGTMVTISVLRRSSEKLIDFNVKRATIPIKSVEVSYMVNKTTGYVKISRFSKNTHSEFLDHALKLKSMGMENLIMDLRANGGGYLNSAIKLADEFLEKEQLIVYTEGKARPRTTYYATKEGNFKNTGLAILVDENSASASEILAGAIQDNDKGVIIGRRTFGKGLVQEQVLWPDKSAIRLTIARYYTPTGRSIQKTYSNGKQDYYKETYGRFERGELMEKDSIHFPDSLKYYTSAGRIVYGGGGIMPDYFIPLDTTEASLFLTELFQLSLVSQFAFEYVDSNRERMKQYRNFEHFNKTFSISEKLFNEFLDFTEKNGVKTDFTGLKKSGKLIRTRLKAHIARQQWKNEGFYPIINDLDHTFQKALSVLSNKGVLAEQPK